MASNINYINIDETYPMAGKDNDSQGFRDNFHYIKNSLSAAKNEIEDIQLYGARKDQVNNFNNLNITNANFVNCSQGVYNGGTTTLIDFANGPYQVFTVNADDTVFTVTGFPGSAIGAGKITVHLFSTSIAKHSISFNITGTNLLKSTAVKALTLPIVCSQTTASTDYITCASTATLLVNQPIQFSGVGIGGIAQGNNYYVKTIDADGYRFSVSTTVNNGVAGDTLQLSDQTASTMSIAPKIIVPNPTTPLVFEFWSTDGGTNVLMDYRGTYSA
jgi:hypothetical protein